MYHRNSIETDVNLLREDMYFSRTQNIETIPPTKNSLFLHVLRSLYQSGIWSCSIEDMQNLPSPREFGWKENNGTVVRWIPNWMTQNEASRDSRLHVKCGCKTPCSNNKKCTCYNADLPCTGLCSCTCSNRI